MESVWERAVRMEFRMEKRVIWTAVASARVACPDSAAKARETASARSVKRNAVLRRAA